MKPRALLAFCLMLFLGTAAVAEEGAATFIITNSSSQDLAVKLFSKKPQGKIWPAPDSHWDITDAKPHAYRISCEIGDQICFGIAWNDGRKTWGVGPRGNLTCPVACCLTCAPPSENVRHHWEINDN